MQITSLENLSLEEIEQLLPQLQQQLEKAEELPIEELVDNEFNNEWELIQACLNQEHEESLEDEYQHLYVSTVLETVLNSYLGEEMSRLFLQVAQKCLKENSFRHSQLFYTKAEDKICRSIGRLSFTLLQLNLGLIRPGDAKATIKECLSSPSVEEVYQTYQQLGIVQL